MAAPALHPDAACQAAFQLHMAGDLTAAAQQYSAVLRQFPRHAATLQALGILMCQTSDFASGAELLEMAEREDRRNPDIPANLGNALRVLERHEESASACMRALALNPMHAVAWSNLSAALRVLGKIPESLEAAANASQLDPGFVEAAVNESCALLVMGRHAEAVQKLRRATMSQPGNLYAWNNCLMAMQYSDETSAKEAAGAARSFGGSIVIPPRPPMEAKFRRVGFLSGDLLHHPVGLFLEPLLAHWPNEFGELFLFANQTVEDEVSERLRNHASWHPIHHLGDDAAAGLIRELSIDVLVDLSGHTAKGRLGVFAQRPAPVQVSWLGYSATTGLPAIDAVIGDDWVAPDQHAACFTERIVRLPESFLCARAPSHSQQPASHLPSESPLLISFNNPSKITETTVRMWAAVLQARPQSNLLVKYRGLEDPRMEQNLQDRLARHGVDQARVSALGHVESEQHFSLFQSAALALDTFPYSGATTTVDSLWMGVPVVTMVGDRYASRMSASVLASAGCRELIAGSEQEFVDIACQWIDQPERRRIFAQTIRQQMQESPLMDAPAFASGFAAGLCGLWDQIRSGE